MSEIIGECREKLTYIVGKQNSFLYLYLIIKTEKRHEQRRKRIHYQSV